MPTSETAIRPHGDQRKREADFLSVIRRNAHQFRQGVEKSSFVLEARRWERDVASRIEHRADSSLARSAGLVQERVAESASLRSDFAEASGTREHLRYGVVWRVIRLSSPHDPASYPPDRPELQALVNLPWNWDGYGSPPVTEQALRTADVVLRASDHYPIGVPDVAPVTGGGVFIEWEAGGRDLEIEILPGGRLQFVKIHEDGRIEEGYEVPPAELLSLLRWLAGETAAK